MWVQIIAARSYWKTHSLEPKSCIWAFSGLESKGKTNLWRCVGGLGVIFCWNCYHRLRPPFPLAQHCNLSVVRESCFYSGGRINCMGASNGKTILIRGESMSHFCSNHGSIQRVHRVNVWRLQCLPFVHQYKGCREIWLVKSNPSIVFGEWSRGSIKPNFTTQNKILVSKCCSNIQKREGFKPILELIAAWLWRYCTSSFPDLWSGMSKLNAALVEAKISFTVTFVDTLE